MTLSVAPLPTWLLKQCPKCHGDLLLDRNAEEPGYSCLQCGYPKSLKFVEPLPLVRRVAEKYEKRPT